MTSSGEREVKSKPTAPVRKRLSFSRFGANAVSGVLPRATAMTLVLPKKSLHEISPVSDVRRIESMSTYRPSENSVRTSFRYVLRILSTEKTKRWSYCSTDSRILANKRRVCSLWFFLLVLDSWTRRARLETGILTDVAGLVQRYCWGGPRVFRKIIAWIVKKTLALLGVETLS